MNTDDITRLAREAGFTGFDSQSERLHDFARLVAAAERNRMIADGWRQCAQGQKTSQFCGMVEQARLEEREACAKVCEYASKPREGEMHSDAQWAGLVLSAAIRARSKE
jgi:hypothetical protein